MWRSFVLGSLIVFLGVVWGTVRASAADDGPIDKGLRVATSGHSFHLFVPDMVFQLSQSAGIPDHVVVRGQALDAFKMGKEVDVLTASPFSGNVLGPDKQFTALVDQALQHNPGMRIVVQVSWLASDDPKNQTLPNVKTDWNAATVERLQEIHAPYLKSVREQVQALNDQHGKQAIFLVPVAQATIALREKIIAGQAPGLKTQEEIFRDPRGHALAPLQVLTSYCNYAVIYRRTPVGLPYHPAFKQADNPAWEGKLDRLLQELAWEAVVKEPLSGVKPAEGAQPFAGPPISPPRAGPVQLTEYPIKYEKITYRQTPQADLKMHVYYPPDWQKTDRRPAIVFFFSGGWDTGSYTQFVPHAKYFASRGMVACCADYRTRLAHKTMPDQCVVDAKAAVRWLRIKAQDLGIDANRIVAAGGSAGGHLAAATALVPGFDAQEDDLAASPVPNALVMFNPPLNFKGGKILDGDGNNIAERIAPTPFLNAKVPPAILYGTKDGMKAQGSEYVARCKELGVRTEMYLAEDEPHGFYNRSPWVETTVEKADAFLQSLGYLQGLAQVKIPENAKPLE